MKASTEEPKLHDHSQMKKTTLIISLSHVSRSGTYMLVSEQSVLIISVLDAGGTVRRKDPSDFDKGKIVMSRRLGRSISETARLVDCSLINSGPSKDKP